jgi:hypothetical protein
MLLARLSCSVRGLWRLTDGYGHAVLWHVTAGLDER